MLKKLNIDFIGPAPCPFERLNSYYRDHIIIKTKRVEYIIEKIKKDIQKLNTRPNIFYIEIDVDPLSML